MVSAQLAVASVLVVAGALVAGSLTRVWQEEAGFTLDGTARIRVTPPRGATAIEIEGLLADLRRVPGVLAAGGVATSVLHGVGFSGSNFDAPAHIPGPPPGSGLAPGSVGILLQSMAITDGYLQTAGLGLLDGRLPTADEFASGAPVLVVSESVARDYWSGLRAIGQTLVSNEFMRGPSRAFTVVGIVEDARYAALDRDAYGAIYYLNTTSPRPWLGTILVRLDNSGSLADVGSWLQDRCSRCTIYGPPVWMNDLLAASIRPRTFNAWLFASFAIASVVVTGAGMLGVVAMASSRRTKEIGIRLALGATPAGVVGQIVREQAGAVAVGLAAGGLAAVWAVRLVESYLYKVTLYDLPTWTAAIGVLLAVALIGAVIPSARASRLDPLQALREE
jgi:hypothetical protein